MATSLEAALWHIGDRARIDQLLDEMGGLYRVLRAVHREEETDLPFESWLQVRAASEVT